MITLYCITIVITTTGRYEKITTTGRKIGNGRSRRQHAVKTTDSKKT